MVRRALPVTLFLTLAAAGCAFAQQAAAPKTIDADELSRLLEEKKVYFIDVREPDEIKQLGSVTGYVNIPLGQLESRLNEVPKDKLIVTL
jgi:rhodanese-related sulfurtransferase